MIESAIFILIMVVSMFLTLANAIYGKQKRISIHTIEFLNKVLSSENRKSYRLTRSFDYAYGNPGSFPVIIEKNLANYYYKDAITEYKSKKKMVKIVNLVFIPLIILLVLTLVFKYPEYVNELMKNDGAS